MAPYIRGSHRRPTDVAGPAQEMLTDAGASSCAECQSFRNGACQSFRNRQAPFPGVRWPDAEGQALLAWADAVIAFHLHGTVSVLGLIEAVLEMGMRSDEIVRAWSEVSDELRRAQIDADWQPTFSNDEDVCAEAAKLAEWMGAQGQM